MRFPEKPRTAGLCGRAARISDCGPLSCAFIERVNKGRKPPKRDLVGRGIRIPKGSVSHCRTGFTGLFHTSLTNAATFVSRGCVGLHTPPRLLTVHTAAHTAKHGRFGWGWYHYPRSVPHVSETLRGRGLKRQTLPLLGLGRGCSQRTQRAFGTAMRLCASLSRGVAAPLGCVIFFAFVEIAACMPCAQGLSVCARRGVVSLPSARFTCC